MPSTHAARVRLIALTFGLSAAGLSGCGTVDDALFGDQTAPHSAPAPAPVVTETPAAPQSTAEAQPAPLAEAAETPAPMPVAAGGELGISLVAIESAASTGTTVGQTVDKLHGEVSALHDKAAGDLQQLAMLKSSATQDITNYQDAKSRIIIRLQAGTTKANPELVKQWNTSQSALDSLAGNINAYAQLGSGVGADLDSARKEQHAIADAMNMPGGVDEDRRQLTVLQQETDQLASALSEMQNKVARSVQRQTAFAANERDGLATLETAIKNGELYPTTDVSEVATASLSPVAPPVGSGNAIVRIRFDKATVNFEQDLYTALNKTLQAKPGASFRIVALSPTQGSAEAVQAAQRDAHKHAEDVLKSMTDMGVPAARVSIASLTDPSVSASEVRVYAK